MLFKNNIFSTLAYTFFALIVQNSGYQARCDKLLFLFVLEMDIYDNTGLKITGYDDFADKYIWMLSTGTDLDS